MTPPRKAPRVQARTAGQAARETAAATETTTARPGRPRGDAARDRVIQATVTDDELCAVASAAVDAGTTVSTWVREAIMARLERER